MLIDKPINMTSFDVVQLIRKKYQTKKVGHAGTLDPLASGLLLVAVGPATKQIKNYVELNKVYEAEICIGEKSATGDAEGPIVETALVGTISEKEILDALHTMKGILRLPVSLYSAMKRGGEPLYKKVRRGERPTVPIRDMEVLTAELIQPAKKAGNCLHVFVRFTVGSGTYVRSLAEEVGKRLGYPARLENLRRTAIGTFHISEAQPLAEDKTKGND